MPFPSPMVYRDQAQPQLDCQSQPDRASPSRSSPLKLCKWPAGSSRGLCNQNGSLTRPLLCAVSHGDLEGSPPDTAVTCCRAFFEGKHAELDAELFSRHREAFPRETFTLDAFLWAVATVRSRVHSPLDGDYVAMVPLADLVRLVSLPCCPMCWLLPMISTARF